MMLEEGCRGGYIWEEFGGEYGQNILFKFFKE